MDADLSSLNHIKDYISQLTGNALFGSILLALILIVVTAIVAKIAVHALRKMMIKSDNPYANSSFFVTVIRVLIWGLGICIVLESCFGVNMTAIIAALGVGGIALSLGFQDTLSNVIGGAAITFTNILKPGDNIKVSGYTGIVLDVNWRHTTIKNRAGETVLIPNSVISKNPVVHLPPPEHVVVPIAVTNTKDLDELAREVAEASHKAASELTTIIEEPNVIFTEVMDYGLQGKVILLIQDADKATDVSDAITRAIGPLVR